MPPLGLESAPLRALEDGQEVFSHGLPSSQWEQEREALSRCLPPLPLWTVRGDLPTDLPHPHCAVTTRPGVPAEDSPAAPRHLLHGFPGYPSPA